MSDLLCPGVPTSALGEMGCAVAGFGGRPWLILAVTLLLLAGIGWFVRRRRTGGPPDHRAPRIIFPASVPGPSPSAEPAARSASSRSTDAWRVAPVAERHAPKEPVAWRDPPAAEPPRSAVLERFRSSAAEPPPSKPPPSSIAEASRAPVPLPEATAEAAAETVDAGPVRFHRPLDATLQLLPGRLEIVSGEGTGQEIRFVRLPSVKPAVTFGRSPGPAHQHVQLRSPTVSQLHARFQFNGGTWSVTNLSTTNPTVLNGRQLTSETEEVALTDGDRIEIGEIVFTFHQQETRDRLALRSSWYTDRGRRSTNQDAVVVRTISGGREVAIVCDGMGSHLAGGVASHIAVEALTEALQGGASLEGAVRRANEAVWLEARGTSDHEGMATTMVVLLREGEAYRIANVGDSRAYRIDPEGIEQITRDHSFEAEAVRAGEMSSEDAARSPWKNAVTRMVGSEEQVEPDLFGPFPISDPHLVVLCSDGIHGVFSDQDLMQRIIAAPEIDGMARDLGEAALRQGSTDNVGVAVIAFAGGLTRVAQPAS